jgi:1-aminocyclopropane-1-carboxylate deaminase/D-cysteine desulfhydrase-like pyridoxal-dependent ACC family enzyme
LDAKAYGMELVFLDRKTFDEELRSSLQPPPEPSSLSSPPSAPHPLPYLIPMGGYGEKGARGAAGILDHATRQDYTHIFCAAGTGTMAAGLSMKAGQAEIWAVNVVRGNDLAQDIFSLAPGARIQIINGFHFGAFGKTSPALVEFMNQFYLQNSVPTDFVYTARLMYAIEDLLQKRSIPRGSRILAIHSGGLQGNKSLKKGQLSY